MSKETRKRPEEELHGERLPRPRFGPGSGDKQAAGSPNDPQNNRVASRDSLKKDEETAEKGPGLENREPNDLPYRVEDKLPGITGLAQSLGGRPLRFIRNNPKKSIGGALTGVGLGGIIYVAGILQGPLQFIHLAQNLQNFHFSSVDDSTNNRAAKLVRYMRHTSRNVSHGEAISRTRVGYFADKWSSKIEARQRQAGIESGYSDRFGWKERTYINQNFFGERNMSPQEVKSALESEYKGIKVGVDGDGAYIDNKDMGYLKNRRLEYKLMREAGYGRVLSALGGRIMSSRAGYVLHPLEKVDRKALQKFDEVYEDWKKKRTEKIKEGSSRFRFSFKKEADPNPDDTNDKGPTSNEAQGEIERLRDGKVVKGSLGAAAGVGIACGLKAVNDSWGQIKEAEVIMPSIRMAMDTISLGAQIQAGDDFDVHQLESYQRHYYGEDSSGKKSSFNQAKSFLGEQGKDGGVEESEALKTIGAGKPFGFLEETGVKQALSGACSTAGQIGFLAVSLFVAPVSTVVTTAVDEFLGLSEKAVNLAAGVLSGQAIDPLAKGADLGNIVNYGSRLAANSQASSNGGTPLSKDQERQLAMLQRQADQADFQSNSFFARMFDLHNSRSLAVSILGTTNFSRSLSNLPGIFPSVKTLVSNFSSIVLPKTSADNAVYDYGFEEIGFSLDEMSDGSVENPYSNAAEVVTTILPAHEDWIEDVEKCFGAVIDKTSYDVTPSLDKQPSFEDVNSSDCKKSGDKNWMKVRFYVFDSNVAISASCYEGDAGACSQLGVEASSTNTDTTDSGGTVSGDVKELAQELLNLADGGKIDIDNYYSESPASDEADRSTPRKQLEDLADGKPAKGSTRCGHNNSSIKPDPKLMQFLVDLASDTKYTINSLFGQCHSSTSLHYQGKAVDFGCNFDTSAGDRVGPKYGVQRNFETCAANGHWHYSVGGG